MTRACKNCLAILEDEETCPVYGGQPGPKCDLSRDFHGYLVVLSTEKSAVAQRMGVGQPGKYALKVR